MFSIYDSECPICRGPKMKIVETKFDEGSIFRKENWSYDAQSNEVIIEGCCSECGVKFVCP